jgi:hypothetical protein
MIFSVIAAKDGDTFHDTVEAVDQEEAERLAREQVAEAWDMMDFLTEAVDSGDPTLFDCELDGFAVDPEPPSPPSLALDVLARTFADAKDAPTSFEDPMWLDGFEDARGIIAHRLALALPEGERRAFLAAAGVEAAS